MPIPTPVHEPARVYETDWYLTVLDVETGHWEAARSFDGVTVNAGYTGILSPEIIRVGHLLVADLRCQVNQAILGPLERISRSQGAYRQQGNESPAALLIRWDMNSYTWVATPVGNQGLIVGTAAWHDAAALADLVALALDHDAVLAMLSMYPGTAALLAADAVNGSSLRPISAKRIAATLGDNTASAGRMFRPDQFFQGRCGTVEVANRAVGVVVESSAMPSATGDLGDRFETCVLARLAETLPDANVWMLPGGRSNSRRMLVTRLDNRFQGIVVRALAETLSDQWFYAVQSSKRSDFTIIDGARPAVAA